MKTYDTGTPRQGQLQRNAFLPLLGWVLLVCLPLLAPPALGASLSPGSYFWYAPEHEKYSRTQFFTEPSFNSALVSIQSTTRFQLVEGERGWATLEFDSGTRAYIPLRLLRLVLHDEAASDPWYEFKRASVFSEEPSKIEARLKSPVAEPRTAEDSKTPIWKRYKERWSINQRRSSPTVSTEGETSIESRQQSEKKPRNPYPLLTPIGPQTGAQRSQEPDASSSEADQSSTR